LKQLKSFRFLVFVGDVITGIGLGLLGPGCQPLKGNFLTQVYWKLG